MKNFIYFLCALIALSNLTLEKTFATAHSQNEKKIGRASVDEVENNDEENTDAVSRWGSEVTEKKVTRSVNLPIPISDTSFEKGTSRAPASAGGDVAAGRAPATLQPTDQGAPPKAVVRAIAQQKAYQEAAVIANDQGFFPSTLFVTQGIPVKLYVTGASPRSQCFMIDSMGIRRQIKNQKIDEINFTPDQSGTFSFSCPMNGAKGVLVVKELELGRLPASMTSANGDAATPPAVNPEKPAAKENASKSEIKDSDFGADFNDE